MDETQNNAQLPLTDDLFRGGFGFFLLYSGLLYLLGARNWLFVFPAALLLKNVSAHLCRNEINLAAGSALSFLSLFFIVPFAGVLEGRLAALPFYAKVTAVLKLDTVTWKTPAVQGALVLVLTAASCFCCNAFSRCVPEIKAGRKAQEWILLVHRLTVYLFLGGFTGFLLRTASLHLKFSSASGWFLQLAGCVLPFLLIGRIRREIAEDLKKADTGSVPDGPQCMTIPDTKLADVAGMEEVKRQLYLTMIHPLQDKEQAERYGIKAGGGILLYGPPGNGKTFLARAVAGELKLPFYVISSADIFAKYVGESEQNIKNIFGTIRKNKAAILFIDELESIFRKRSDDVHETTRKVISLLLQELDGIEKHENSLLLIGATNTPWLIDEAFMRSGRFDSLIYVGLPDCEARLQILRQSFRDMSCPIEKDLLECTAKVTEGFSGADLKGIATRIKQLAFERRAGSCGYEIFKEVLQHAAPSVNREIMQQLEQWKTANALK